MNIPFSLFAPQVLPNGAKKAMASVATHAVQKLDRDRLVRVVRTTPTSQRGTLPPGCTPKREERGMNTWLPWIYQYGLGGLVFVASLVYLRRVGALRLNLWFDRRLLIALVVGLLMFMTAHAIWIVSATS